MLEGILPECLPELSKYVTRDPLLSKKGYIAELQYILANLSLLVRYLD